MGFVYYDSGDGGVDEAWEGAPRNRNGDCIWFDTAESRTVGKTQERVGFYAFFLALPSFWELCPLHLEGKEG